MKSSPKGQHQNFQEIAYLYNAKIELFTPSPVYLYKRIPLFQSEKGNSLVKIEAFTPSLPLTLHCKDREFPRNFYVVPKWAYSGGGYLHYLH